VILLDAGKVAAGGPALEILGAAELLEKRSLDIPPLLRGAARSVVSVPPPMA
jgi:hypothetical protein